LIEYKKIMGTIFSVIFHALSLLLVLLASYNFVEFAFNPQGEFMATVIQAINTFVIALAMFELGAGISKEYSSSDEEENIYSNIRRVITRFVGTVCIVLVLEALIMIIKYSQLELAGNLYYPVSILFGSSFLLVALGAFLRLTIGHKE
jgi:O-antigen/teichoic acid export membrane protein